MIRCYKGLESAGKKSSIYPAIFDSYHLLHIPTYYTHVFEEDGSEKVTATW